MQADTPPAPAGDSDSAHLIDHPLLATDRDFIELAFWLILGRDADEPRRAELERALELGQTRANVVLSIFTSAEFLLRRQSFIDQVPDGRRERQAEQALSTRGTNAELVDAAYRYLLGRVADPSGLASYVQHLEQGLGRTALVRALVISEEFEERYRRLCPANGILPRDRQLCELANPAKWDNPEWMAILHDLQVLSASKLAMHRKAYEFTQTVFGLKQLGYLRDDARILSVGAGHEALAYWLANHVRRVIGVDLYRGEWVGSRAAEGDLRAVINPEGFAPFPYRTDRLRFLQMDGGHLAFAAASFDVTYSLSSIEHFGGWEASRLAVEEMARVTRPGGLLVIATDFWLGGPRREEVFMPDEFRALVAMDGLEPIEPLDDRVWSRYTGVPVDIYLNPYQTPHMLLTDRETLFTTVIVFLRKTAERTNRRANPL